MQYILSYKGKTLGKPMTQEQAEIKLKQMSQCFNDLEIVPYVREQQPVQLAEKHIV